MIAAPGEASVEIASCGRPAPGVVVSIAPAEGAVIDAAGAPAANGQAHAAVAMAPEDPSGARVGEICVQGESVTAGYWNDAAPAGVRCVPATSASSGKASSMSAGARRS